MTITHITFGNSAYGTLKYAFQQKNEYKDEKIICMNEDLSIGPIYALTSDEGMKKRKKWLKDVMTMPVNWIENSLQKNVKIAERIPSHSKVILWHGENTSDAAGVRFVLSLLQDKQIQFEEVHVTKFSHHISYQVEDEQGGKIPHVLNSLAEMPPELIFEALQMKKELPQEQVQHFIQDWEKHSQSTHVLRTLVDGKITNVSEEYYDKDILEHASNEYQGVSLVVGNAIEKSEQSVSDLYLHFRVHQLIQKGKLNTRGHDTKKEIRLP